MLRGYAEIAATAPDELTVMAGFLGTGGQMLLFLFPAWSGDPARGQDAITALQQLGTPVMAQVAPMPYSGALGMFNQSVVNGRRYALATRWLPGLTDDTAAMLIAGARSATSPLSAIAIHHFHGAAARIPAPDTAFALRRDHLLVEILAAWEPSPDTDPAAHRAWAGSLSGQLAPSSLPGGYPNLLGPAEPDRVLLAYGPNARRLQDLKHRYDPDGVFSTATGTLPAALRTGDLGATAQTSIRVTQGPDSAIGAKCTAVPPGGYSPSVIAIVPARCLSPGTPCPQLAHEVL